MRNTICRAMFALLLTVSPFTAANAAPREAAAASKAVDVLETPSHRPGLFLRLLHQRPGRDGAHAPVLFLHGASFPAELAFAFRMDGASWMDVMAAKGYDTYALDFLGYGRSDRYPEMAAGGAAPLGRAREVVEDVDRAVDLIRTRTGQPKVTLIAHSWGGSVAALYAQNHPAKLASLVLFAAVTPRFGPVPAAPAGLTQGSSDMTPGERIQRMDSLRPAGQPEVLAPEVFNGWGERWLASDPLATAGQSAAVRFPAGPEQDIADLKAGVSYYDPTRIAVPTLLVRGEWDTYPSAADFTWLYSQLSSAPCKKHAVIRAGTHVVHLERSRHLLHSEVLAFLKAAAC